MISQSDIDRILNQQSWLPGAIDEPRMALIAAAIENVNRQAANLIAIFPELHIEAVYVVRVLDADARIRAVPAAVTRDWGQPTDVQALVEALRSTADAYERSLSDPALHSTHEAVEYRAAPG